MHLPGSSSHRGFGFGSDSKLTARELQEFEQAFSMLDVDKSGTIEKNELARALRAIGEKPSKKELDEMFDLIEKKKHSNRIGFMEFCEFMKQYGRDKRLKRSTLREIFRELDKDRSGKLEKSEIKQGLLKCGLNLNQKDVEHLVSQLDKDGDMCVDYDEFVMMLLK
ncbi:unnamed protein product [Calicophoron daubneyi]|uniref:EF-hand domain-containing protein n=1 Tax=Calicophoron daubneyi TaxID=300641 RepID=A0AAV2T6F0_CALDB